MRRHYIARIRDNLPRIPQNLQKMRRVHASGLFDAGEYKRVNREIRFGALRCLWHWVNAGHPEDRVVAGSPLACWLIPLLTQNEISIDGARRLMRAGDHQSFRDECAALNLNINEYYFIERYLNCDFAAAGEYLEKTSGLFYLRAIHRALRAMPKLSDIRGIYKKIKDDLPGGAGLNNSDLEKFRDIAFAGGETWDRIAELNRLIEKNKKQPASPLTPARLQSEDYRIFRNAAARNALKTDGFEAVKLLGGDLIIEKAPPDAIILFTPDAPVWTSPGENETLIRKAFETVTRYILSKGVSIAPFPPPFTRDLSYARIPPFRAVSYHTYARRRSDIIHYKELSLRGFFLVDRMGYGGASEISITSIPAQSAAMSRLKEIRDKYVHTDLTKYASNTAQNSGLSAPQAGGEYVFVPLQVFDDSSQRWQGITSYELLEIVAEYYSGSSTRVAAKRHPFDRTPLSQKLLDRLASEDRIVIADEPVKDLLSRAKIVFTANSGVGLEALLLGKPVISTGGSEYQSCTYHCRSKEEIAAAIEAIAASGPCEYRQSAERFLSNFFQSCVFDASKAEKGLADLDRTPLREFVMNGAGRINISATIR